MAGHLASLFQYSLLFKIKTVRKNYMDYINLKLKYKIVAQIWKRKRDSFAYMK